MPFGPISGHYLLLTRWSIFALGPLEDSFISCYPWIFTRRAFSVVEGRSSSTRTSSVATEFIPSLPPPSPNPLSLCSFGSPYSVFPSFFFPLHRCVGKSSFVDVAQVCACLFHLRCGYIYSCLSSLSLSRCCLGN